MSSGPLLALHLPCLSPQHLLAPRLGVATGCYRWVHANSKYLQHHGSSSSQGAGLAPPPDSGPPTSHLQEHGMERGNTGLEKEGIFVGLDNTLSTLMLEVRADGPSSQSWILRCKDQGSFVPWFLPRDVPPSLHLSLWLAFRAPSSPQLSVLPPGPSVHTIAVDQNDGQHVILAQHSPGRVPAGFRRPVL